MQFLTLTGTVSDLVITDDEKTPLSFSLTYTSGNGTKKTSVFEIVGAPDLAAQCDDMAIGDGDKLTVMVRKLKQMSQQYTDDEGKTQTALWLRIFAETIQRVDPETPDMVGGMAVGNVGNDAEMAYTNQGTPYTRFSLPLSWSEKDADGKDVEITTWARCTIWGKKGSASEPNAAERAAEKIVKGASLCVMVQSMHYDAYTKADGTLAASLDMSVFAARSMSRGATQSKATPPPAALRAGRPPAPPAAVQTADVPY
jgi:single-stranded DNA-binding protein